MEKQFLDELIEHGTLTDGLAAGLLRYLRLRFKAECPHIHIQGYGFVLNEIERPYFRPSAIPLLFSC